MFLEKLSLLQFKNYDRSEFLFSSRVTGICGKNGMGKTNLLDAIYYLGFTKSYFTKTDAVLVKKGEQGFRISGDFKSLAGQEFKVLAILRETGKKEISLNEDLYTRNSAHVGKFPAVIIAPDDINIITGSSEERRKMADALLCQLDAAYLQQLINYNKILQQRNSLLKQMAATQKRTDPLLDIYDEQLAETGGFIHTIRMEMLTPYLEKAMEHYQKIAGKDDFIRLEYKSQLQNDKNLSSKQHFLRQLSASREKDRILQRTTVGTHRDDLTFFLLDQPFKQLASQGQRKSLLFALKLTEFEMLEDSKGFPPILLLDDVFEKLDDDRMSNLLMEVCIEKKGQVFITDTHKERLQEGLEKIGAEYEIVEI